MGSRGPIPKRSDEAQHPKTLARKERTTGGITHVGSVGEVKPPAPDPEWGPIAMMLWDAALESPQMKQCYQATDWAVLYSLCDDISYYKAQERRSGQMLASINTLMTSLLFTEGDRRRVGIEVSRNTPEQLKSQGVALLEDVWKKRNQGKS